ncbi:MAG TPA: aminoglycoside adenylyltransferase family protein [Hyphomicrobiaceae bacterium]|jgi:streptomycin 3"-adenylyltransferase
MIPALANEPESHAQIAATVDIVRDVLGEAVCAACLYGSAVAGGLRPSSDLDILVVSNQSLNSDAQAAIIRQLLPISGRHGIRGSARSLELSIVARSALVPWRYPPSIELQYGDWMRAEFERGKLPEWPKADPDVAVLVETARRASVPLFGEPISAVLEPVPRADLVRAMRDTVPVLMPGIEEGDDVRNGLLTLARIWTTLATGEIRPKDEAASWALTRLPEEHRAVLAHARATYRGETPENWSALGPRLRPHVDYVVARIDELASVQVSNGQS